MSIIQTIKNKSLEARKGNYEVAKNLLVTLYSEAANVGKNAGNRETTDAECIAVIKKFIKGTDETINALNGDVRANIAIQEKVILESLLPKQMTEEDIRAEIASIVSGIVNPTPKSMGIVMKTLKDKYDGLYDGNTASKIVKEILA